MYTTGICDSNIVDICYICAGCVFLELSFITGSLIRLWVIIHYKNDLNILLYNMLFAATHIDMYKYLNIFLKLLNKLNTVWLDHPDQWLIGSIQRTCIFFFFTNTVYSEDSSDLGLNQCHQLAMAECAPVTSDPCCALLHISPLGPNWSWCSTYSLPAPKHATAFIPKLPFSVPLSRGTVFWVSSLILLLTSVWSMEADTHCSLSYCACSPMHLHYNGSEWIFGTCI